MNAPNTPQEHVARVLRAYDGHRRHGCSSADSVAIAAVQLRVPRETVMKAIAVREARLTPIGLAA